MKRNDKLKRMAIAAEALCRGEEQELVREQQRLAQVRAYAQKLSSLDGASNNAITLLPGIWCRQVSKTYSEIARLDAEVGALANNLSLTKARRDKIAEQLRRERTRERLAQHEKQVEAHLEMTLLHRPNRLR